MKTRLLVLVLLLLAISAAPALAQGPDAQEPATHTVGFDGIRFSYDDRLAHGVNITVHPDDAETTFPPEVGHVQFLLYAEPPAPESLFDSTGGVRVYPVEGFTASGFEAAASQLEALRALLDTRPDLATYQTDVEGSANLPFLPVLAAGQTLRAGAVYLESEQVRGIRYLTAWQEAAEPLLSDSLLYTFQGLSTDGRYVIAVTFRLRTGLLPAETGPDFDIAAFVDGLAAYQAETTALIGAAGPADFAPALDALDALVLSLGFGE